MRLGIPIAIACEFVRVVVLGAIEVVWEVGLRHQLLCVGLEHRSTRYLRKPTALLFLF